MRPIHRPRARPLELKRRVRLPIMRVVGTATEPHPIGAIATAEAAFAAGDHTTAERLLTEVLSNPGTSGAEGAEAESDLAVIALARGRPEDAEAHLLWALARMPECLPALENLAILCRTRGDLVEATHWARRLTIADPTSSEAWSLLTQLLDARSRHDDAEHARAQALSHGARTSVRPMGRAPTAGPIAPVAVAPTRVLVIVDHFHPSLGGSERLAEAAGAALGREGFTVGVATRANPMRSERMHRGMVVHEIEREPERELAAIVAEHGYEAAIVFADPASWPLWAALSLPEPRPRIIAVPCINGDGYANLTRNPAILARYRDAIRRADVLGVSSRAGADARLASELELPSVYLPNASEEPASDLAAAVRSEGEADRDGDGALLMVANLWPEKNHLGLLSQLEGSSGRWRLELIGEAAEAHPEIAAEVQRHASRDPRLIVRGRAEPAEVAAAMDAADVLLLPSLAEATPIVLLEAMSRSLPWIATPACGSAHDHAGGLIVPVWHFREAIDFLLGDRSARTSLGEAGRAHWEASYRWEVIGRRYAAILRGHEPAGIDIPEAARKATDAVRERFYDARVARLGRGTGFHTAARPAASPAHQAA